jgi:hypothetical protein
VPEGAVRQQFWSTLVGLVDALGVEPFGRLHRISDGET